MNTERQTEREIVREVFDVQKKSSWQADVQMQCSCTSVSTVEHDMALASSHSIITGLLIKENTVHHQTGL